MANQEAFRLSIVVAILLAFGLLLGGYIIAFQARVAANAFAQPITQSSK